MKLFFPLIMVLILSSSLCLAQEPRGAGDFLDDPALKEFNAVADTRQDKFLFKTLRFTAPFARVYHVLWLDKEGNAFKARYVTDWAVQNSRHGKLNAEQLEEVKRMLAGLHHLPKPVLTRPEKGETFTTVVFLTENEYMRHDYTGSLPVEAQGVIEFLDSEIEKQERHRHEEWLKRRQEGQQSKPQL